MKSFNAPKTIFFLFVFSLFFIAFAACGDDGRKEDQTRDFYKKAIEYYKSNKYDEAFSFFTKAAINGHERAQFSLGVCFYCGYGVPQNSIMTLSWYRLAAEHGLPQAQKALYDFNMDPENKKNDQHRAEAYYWRLKSLQHGNAEAQFFFLLGESFHSGDGIKLEKDEAEKEAIKWYRKAADMGFDEAQNELGKYYYNDKKNNQEAAKWFRKAADQGFAKAQYNLGLCYENGYGETQNKSEAVNWYRKAAEQGFPLAQNKLGKYYYNDKENYQEAAKWFRKAADQGFAKAQRNLGLCYENGQGVDKKDLEKAKEWYRKAAEQGNADAEKALKRLTDTK